jgi:hypothetical protein
MAQLHFDFTTIDWKVVIATLAFIVALITLVYFQWWRNRKRLSYEILSNAVLVSAEGEIRDSVEIRFAGQPVTNVRLIIIKLINDGYIPIKKDDFEKPIRFIFSEATILTAEKVKFNPENLGVEIHHHNDWLEITPALFNRKDYAQFKVLLSGYTGMKVDTRIVGVQKVGQVSNFLSIQEILITVVLLGVPLFLAIRWSHVANVGDIAAFVSLFVSAVFSVLVTRVYRRKRPD